MILPEYLLVELRDPLRILSALTQDENLPTFDIDAILSSMFEAIEQPGLTGKKLEDSLKYLKESTALWSIDSDHLYCQCIDSLTECLIGIRNDIATINPYLDGELPYRYKERRGLHSVLLQKIISPTC